MTYFSLMGRLRPRAVRLWCLLLAGNAVALAQQYTISTIAGGAPPATPNLATSVSIGPPQRVTTDAGGNAYFTSLNCVFKLDTGGTLTLIAGNSRTGFSGDGGPATQAQLNAPQGVAVDSAGNLYIADTGNNRVREVTPDGVIHTVAGTGQGGFFGNGGPATQAMLHTPSGVAVDGFGNVYIADAANHSIRRLTLDGNINQFAGNSYAAFAGDEGPATVGQLHGPSDVFVNAKGVVYIADTGNARIRTVTSDGNIHTVAGGAGLGFTGDGGAATSAALSIPYSVTADATGKFYIADFGNNRIRMVDASGIITTVAGTPVTGFSGDGSAGAKAQLNLATGIALDGSGNVYVADQWNLRIRKIVSSGNISTVAGNGRLSFSGDGGSATRAQFYGPQGVAVDGSGNLYIADTQNAAVRKVSTTGDVSTIASTALTFPRGIATDSAGNVYVSDFQDNRVKRIALDGSVTTVAGNGSPGFAGDGGAASGAQLNGPFGVAVDRSNNVYIADFNNHVIRKVAGNGTITTVAGNTRQGYSGDLGPATQASLDGPYGVAVDAAGNLYIADTGNNVVREVTSDGVIRTIAGTGFAGSAGDTGNPLQAQITAPAGIAVDSAGSVYVSDAAMRIRKILPGSLILTIAGNGVPGYSGDNGLGTLASLNAPVGIAVGANGAVYTADSGNNAVRLLQAGASTITLQAVTNAASNLPGTIAPGEIVVLYGSALGPDQLILAQPGAGGKFANTLGGTVVSFNGVSAPLLYTSPNQVAAVVPFGISGASAQVVASYLGQAAAARTVAVAPTAAALFTLDYSGKGQAAALNQNQLANGASSPAAAGSQLMLFATGMGQTSPPGTDGAVVTAPPPTVALPVVTIGGQPAAVVSASGVPGTIAGLMQIVVQVPAGVQAGTAVPVTLQAGGVSAPAGVTVAVSR